MAGVDGILGIMIQQNADELRMGTDVAPRMYQAGVQKRLSLPETPDDTLRHLLGAILSPEREERLRKDGRVELPYTIEGGPTVEVMITRRSPDTSRASPFDVVFLRGGKRPAAVVPAAPLPQSAIPTPLAMPAPTSVTAAAATVPRDPPSVSSPDDLARPRAPAFDLAPPPTSIALTPASDLARLLAHAASLRASDLHLGEGDPPCVRVDGALRTIGEAPLTGLADLLGPVLPVGGLDALRAGRSLDVAVDVPGVGRARVSVYRSLGGLVAAVRLLPPAPPSLADLRLPVTIEDLAALPHGLVIVCGPTGSGKSTTLAALAVETLRKRAAMLVTLEDPIEHLLPRHEGMGMVRQRQVGSDVRDFPTGLRDALRGDPDVILIGEMRDPESISLALTAAETGHLVLTSLHSRSAPSAIERIVDSYPAERQEQVRVQLADALRAVVSQRLVPRARGGGRAVAMEVLRSTSGVASLVREGKTSQLASAIQAGRAHGMVTLERSLADLVRAGTITREAASAVANDVDALASYVGGA